MNFPPLNPELSAAMRRLVRLRIWLGERVAGNELRATLLWAAVIGLVGAWIGSALFTIGPLIGGVPLISAIIGAVILTALLKAITVRGHAV